MKIKLIVRKDNLIVNELTIDSVNLKAGIIFGRKDDAEVKLDDRSVSREHARLFLKEGKIVLEKKASIADVKKNNELISKEVEIQNEDIVEISPFIIKFEFEKPKEEISKATSSKVQKPEPPKKESETKTKQTSLTSKTNSLFKEPELNQDAVNEIGFSSMNGEENKNEENPQGDNAFQVGTTNDGSKIVDAGSPEDEEGQTRVFAGSVSARLVCIDGPSYALEWQISKVETYLGRGSECEVSFSDKRSSRKNSSIRKDGGRFYIRDLNSANGTFINGKRLGAAEEEIQSGDKIKVGDTLFEITIINKEYLEEKDHLLPINYDQHSHAPSIQGQFNTSASTELATANQMQGNVQTQSAFENDFNAFPGAPGGQANQGGQQSPFGAVHSQDKEIKGNSILIKRFRVFMAWLNKQPPLKRYAIIGLILFGIYTLLGDDNESVKPKKKAPPKTAKADANGVRNYESLPPETKKFIDLTFNTAMEYYGNRDYYRAKFELQKIFDMKLGNYPRDAEAQTLLSECERAIKKKLEEEEEARRREELEKIKNKISELTIECKKYLNKKKDDSCIALFPQILELDPTNQFVEETKKYLEDKRNKEEAIAASRLALDKKKKSARAIFEKGKALYDKKQYHDAIPVLMSLKDLSYRDEDLIFRADEMIKNALKIIKETVSPLMADGKSALEQNDLVTAKKKFGQVLRIDPPNREASSALQGIRQQLHDKAKKFYTEGVIAESLGEIKDAVAKFKMTLETAPEDDEYEDKAQRKLKKYQVIKDMAGGSGDDVDTGHSGTPGSPNEMIKAPN